MKVAILAGGFGTRLGDLTQGLPKPMITIGEKPFLQHVIDSFARCGLTEFVLLTGYRSDVIESYFEDGRRLGVSIEYSRESQPLGTGGAVREARALLSERFVLTYGDVLRPFDYDRFVNAHPQSCLAVYRYPPGSTSISAGNVEVHEGRVTQFVKGAPGLQLPFVDAGFAVVTAESVDLLPADVACSFEETVYPQLAARVELEAEEVDLNFCDIGNPTDLEKTRAILEARQ